jgi:hypothetical protein
MVHIKKSSTPIIHEVEGPIRIGFVGTQKNALVVMFYQGYLGSSLRSKTREHCPFSPVPSVKGGGDHRHLCTSI